MVQTTLVHLLRHGEVDNPDGVLYARLPGFGLSKRGVAMADRAADFLSGRDVALLASSPLLRARQTADPVSRVLGLEVLVDMRLNEAWNVFEGQSVSMDNVLRKPAAWRHLVNPLRPSWGEPLIEVASRMAEAVGVARQSAAGREAVLVSHQLPIWLARRRAESGRLIHNPRRRQCGLGSITTLTFVGDMPPVVSYLDNDELG